jgi:hypothetical protein
MSQHNINWVPTLFDPLPVYTVAAPPDLSVTFYIAALCRLTLPRCNIKNAGFVTLELCAVNELYFRLLFGRDQKHVICSVTTVLLVRLQQTSRKLRKRFGCCTFTCCWKCFTASASVA